MAESPVSGATREEPNFDNHPQITDGFRDIAPRTEDHYIET